MLFPTKFKISFDKKISELYKENLELEKYIYDNYSFNGNDKTKEEIFTSEKIIKSMKRITKIKKKKNMLQ